MLEFIKWSLKILLFLRLKRFCQGDGCLILTNKNYHTLIQVNLTNEGHSWQNNGTQVDLSNPARAGEGNDPLTNRSVDLSNNGEGFTTGRMIDPFNYYQDGDGSDTTRRTIDVNARPQFEMKRFNGIIRVYKNCIGSSVQPHVEGPCIFPFIYHGQVNVILRYIFVEFIYSLLTLQKLVYITF